MQQQTVLFISGSSKRSQYFRRLCHNLPANINGNVILGLTVWWHVYALLTLRHLRVATTDITTHYTRQAINYPIVAKPWLRPIVLWLYTTMENMRLRCYTAYLQAHKPKVVCLWNGSKIPYSTIAQAAKLRGINTLFFENGLLPNTTTADPAGVNAYSSIAQQLQHYNPQLSHTSPATANSTFASPAALPENYIFVPFQISSDSQMVVHSPWMHNFETLFYTLCTLQAKHNLPPLVFKEHPNDRHKYTHLHSHNFKGMFANTIPSQALIAGAALVVTVNSTVGLEALLQHKPVITLGDTFYNINGITQQATSWGALEALLQAPIQQPNPSTLTHFIDFLANEYCVKGDWHNWHNLPQAHFDAVNTRITQLLA